MHKILGEKMTCGGVTFAFLAVAAEETRRVQDEKKKNSSKCYLNPKFDMIYFFENILNPDDILYICSIFRPRTFIFMHN